MYIVYRMTIVVVAYLRHCPTIHLHFVGFEVLAAVLTNVVILWHVVPSQLLGWFFHPEHGGDTFLRNVGSHTDY
jgi:hypothetical protein